MTVQKNGKSSKSRQKNHRATYSHVQESHKNTKQIPITYTKDLVHIHVSPMLAAPVSVSSQETCLVDSERLVPLVISIPSGS